VTVLVLMLDDDDDDDSVGVNIFGIRGGVELPTGGLCTLTVAVDSVWRRSHSLYSDDVASFVIFVVVIVSWLLSMGLICVVALLLADNGVCCWLMAAAIVWHRLAVALDWCNGCCLPLSA